MVVNRSADIKPHRQDGDSYPATARRSLITPLTKYFLTLATVAALGACAPLRPPVESAPDRSYVVQPGDNIHSIAFLLQTTPRQLQFANPRIDTAQLRPGMRISIPASLPGNGSGSAQPGNTGSATEPRMRSADFIWPLKSIEVTSNFGRRYGRLHAGIDLRAPRGTPIRAAAAGKVVFAGYSGGYGRMVVIDHGHGIQTAYAHNSRNLVAIGQRVLQGETIGNVGKTGNATGNHVHFEFRRYGRPLDPAQHLQARL